MWIGLGSELAATRLSCTFTLLQRKETALSSHAVVIYAHQRRKGATGLGTNKDLRRIIAGLEGNAERLRAKVEREMLKPHPNMERIAVWKKEIRAAEERIERLKRRLKRKK
jgi:predicted RNase H-like nuclease (RuvC/YqgF family)